MLFSVRKPQKPPRPLLLKNLHKQPTIVKPQPASRRVTSVNAENQNELNPCVEQRNTTDTTHTCSRSVTVQWDVSAGNPAEHLKTARDSQTIPVASSTPSSESVPVECPVPLPRLKNPYRKDLTEEVTVQTLISLGENGEDIQVTSCHDQESSSNRYIEELLEVFGPDSSLENNNTAAESNSPEPSTGADGEMSAMHSQREVRSRIAAFETQPSTEEQQRPTPQPRNVFIKPPVASKPSLASRSSFKYNGENNNVEFLSTAMPKKPLVAPRPLNSTLAPQIQPAGYRSLEGLQETMAGKVAVLPPSRRSIMAKVKSLEQQHEENMENRTPPLPAPKPFKEPLVPNNHHSAVMATEDDVPSSKSPTFSSCFLHR